MTTRLESIFSYQRSQTLLLIVLLLIVLTAVASTTGSPLLGRVVIGILINVVLVCGIYVFVGNSGIVSFGQVAFACIGAYVTAWLTMRPMMKKMVLPGLPDVLQAVNLGSTLSLVCAAASAALVALIIGAAIMRLSGTAAAIATLAWLAIVNTVCSNADSITGGTGSLAGIRTDLSLWSVFGWTVAALAIASAHAGSASGLALRAVREDEAAARACGIRSYRVRIVAYVISGLICGVAGNLQARYLGVVSPDNFYMDATFLALTMLIIGGMYSLTGAVVGVVVVSAAVELLVRTEGEIIAFGAVVHVPPGTANVIIALIMCLILIKRPLGLVGNREWRFVGSRWRVKRASLSINSEQPSRIGK